MTRIARSNHRFVFITTLIIVIITAVVATNNANAQSDEYTKLKALPYIFDRDQAGPGCANALKSVAAEDDGDSERFKLFCVNKLFSFKKCALTCSKALQFEGSNGQCHRDTKCNFYRTTFTEHTTGNQLHMKDLARNKATLVAVVPLWASQAQYFYELLELVRATYGDDQTEAFVLPMELDIDNPWEEKEVVIDTYHTQRVTLLENTHPQRFAQHPLMDFLTKVRHLSGFQYYDVYTDRPVLFMISPDGKLVDRLVIPTYEQIQSILVDKFGLHELENNDEKDTEKNKATATERKLTSGEM